MIRLIYVDLRRQETMSQYDIYIYNMHVQFCYLRTGMIYKLQVAWSSLLAELLLHVFALLKLSTSHLAVSSSSSPGWSKKYPFNDGDLTICAQVLCNYLNNAAWMPKVKYRGPPSRCAKCLVGTATAHLEVKLDIKSC